MYGQSQTSIYCASINRAPPFTGRAYYFLPNSGFMFKVIMLIVILFTLYIPYRAILPFPERHAKWRFDCNTHIKLESILMKNYMALYQAYRDCEIINNLLIKVFGRVPKIKLMNSI